MSRLCDQVEYGHLMAATRPADLLNAVCDKMDADRKVIEAAHRMARAFASYDDGDPEDPDEAERLMTEYVEARCGLRAVCGAPCPRCPCGREGHALEEADGDQDDSLVKSLDELMRKIVGDNDVAG